ncbi:MAG TPA: ADP-ribosylglycohydrolase family protein [Firmicutes bacterium]|jgi:ADP-ribosylglycohydrolase|nr:ADP-ribosylglycohydrolase family protein [Bacillota bacterium]
MELLEWLTLEQVVNDELIQAAEEGKDVSRFKLKLEQINSLPEAQRRVELQNLNNEMMKAKVRPDYPYVEPTELTEIRRARAQERRDSILCGRNQPKLSRRQLFDRIYGAWLGRCSGCLLGKPVEGMMSDQIAALLKWKKAVPLNFYIAQEGGLPPGFLMDDEQVKRYQTGTFENVNQMLRDDDIDYTMISLMIMEKYGRDFTTADIGATWLQTIPLLMTYTAERVAYRNFANGLVPPESGRILNPYREWIGAQIRGDLWGYINPGNPELAAEYAFRDATLSHYKNGVYGEMFISALIAAAIEAKDLHSAVLIALGEIPDKSRLAETIRQVMEWSEQDQNWETTFERIIDRYQGYNWFHTIPNAAIVVMALLYGNGDFEKSITIAVLAGLDTDCNGATVGSIVGAYLGAARLPSKWIDPLNDRVATAVVGMTDTAISELAERTLAFIG